MFVQCLTGLTSNPLLRLVSLAYLTSLSTGEMEPRQWQLCWAGTVTHQHRQQEDSKERSAHSFQVRWIPGELPRHYQEQRPLRWENASGPPSEHHTLFGRRGSEDLMVCFFLSSSWGSSSEDHLWWRPAIHLQGCAVSPALGDQRRAWFWTHHWRGAVSHGGDEKHWAQRSLMTLLTTDIWKFMLIVTMSDLWRGNPHF